MLRGYVMELKRPAEAIAEYKTVLKNHRTASTAFWEPRAPHKQPATRVARNRSTPNLPKSVAQVPIARSSPRRKTYLAQK